MKVNVLREEKAQPIPRTKRSTIVLDFKNCLNVDQLITENKQKVEYVGIDASVDAVVKSLLSSLSITSNFSVNMTENPLLELQVK